jgi:hypothetical protein
MNKFREMFPISGGIDELDAAIAQAKTNSDLLDSITTFLGTVAGMLTTMASQATDLATLKAGVTSIASDLKSKDDLAAAALVAATPAAAVTPPPAG